MKTPRLLLGATLLFWGWQTGFLIPAAVMAVLLEGARWRRPLWELGDEDFTRLWTFCTLLFLAAAAYAFTANEGPGGYRGLFQNPGPFTSHRAGTATARTAAAVLRWLPMLFFLFIAAQEFSSREGIPLETISLILRRRWKKARERGQPLPATRTVNISYPFFGLCLFAASVHSGEDTSFFWGLCLLVAWGLWPLRSRRFGLALWVGSVGVAIALGYFGQRGIGQLQNYLNNLNPEWLAGFGRRRFDATQSRTDLGRIGRMKASGKVVIRVETKAGTPPSLLREASYREFRGLVWSANISTNDFEAVPAETNETSYVLIRDKPTSATTQIGCYLQGGQGLLPLPMGSARLDNLTSYLPLQKSGLGAVLVPQGPGLVVFDAQFGPGPSFDFPPDDNQDLEVPDRERPALKAVIAEAHLQGKPPDQALRALNTFFLDKFAYSTWQELGRYSRTNQTPLTRFLLRSRQGHCEYFATAGVLLLRQLKIPARYAVGWAVHEGGGGKFVVRERDAHAWCLVWDERANRWRDVDFTPGSWVDIEGRRASPFQALSDLWTRMGFEVSKFRWGQTHLRQYLLWSLVPVLGLLLFQIVFRRRKLRRAKSAAEGGGPIAWPGLDSEFYLLERRLTELGFARHPGETSWSWLHRVVNAPGLADTRAAFEALLRFHYRYRFDPLGLTSQERMELRRQAQDCLGQLARLTTRIQERNG
jgi:protein-glutamine gamma-glutamyltransferase